MVRTHRHHESMIRPAASPSQACTYVSFQCEAVREQYSSLTQSSIREPSHAPCHTLSCREENPRPSSSGPSAAAASSAARRSSKRNALHRYKGHLLAQASCASLLHSLHKLCKQLNKQAPAPDKKFWESAHSLKSDLQNVVRGVLPAWAIDAHQLPTPDWHTWTTPKQKDLDLAAVNASAKPSHSAHDGSIAVHAMLPR